MLSNTIRKVRTQNNYKYQRISDDKTQNKNDHYDSLPHHHHHHHPEHLFYKIICINTEYLFIRFASAVVHITRIFAEPTDFLFVWVFVQSVRARTLTYNPASLPLSLHHRHGTTLVGANKVFHIANFHPRCDKCEKREEWINAYMGTTIHTHTLTG